MIQERILSVSEDGNSRVVECRIDDVLFQVTEYSRSYTVYVKHTETGKGDYYRNQDGFIRRIKAFNSEELVEYAAEALGPSYEVSVFEVSEAAVC